MTAREFGKYWELVISNQLLWEKGEWVFVDNQPSQPHLGSIESILGLIQLLVNLINHRKRTGSKPVNLSSIFQ